MPDTVRPIDGSPPGSPIPGILQAILIPACASSSLEFCMMYPAYTLNKQSDGIQPSCTPFPILNQSVAPCSVLTVASWPTYRFVSQETSKVVWYSHLFENFPQFVMIHIVKSFSGVNEAEVNVFLEFPCFLHDPVNVDNLVSCSFAFFKPSLYIWKFSVHVLLKPSLKDK